MTIKILYHLNQVGYGGTEKAILTFCENLDSSRFIPYLFIHDDSSRLRYYRHLLLSHISSKYDQRFQTLYRHSRARLEDFTNTLGRNHVFTGRTDSLYRTVNTIKPDIIHFNRGKWEPYYDQLISQVPTSTICIETNIFGFPASDNYFNRLAKTYFVSNWLLKKSPWSDSKGSVLYNPIKKPANQLSIRHKLEIPENAFVLGRISRPDLADDNFILEVFNNILEEKNQRDDIYLLILAGSEIMRKAAADNNRIKLISATTDEAIISNFYNSIDLLLHYRIDGETFGMNIAEAMIHGKPVISHLSHVDNAQAELLAQTTQYGIVGYVAPQNDQETYLKYITDLMNDPAEVIVIGNNAKLRAQQLFQEDVLTRYLENEYLKLL